MNTAKVLYQSSTNSIDSNYKFIISKFLNDLLVEEHILFTRTLNCQRSITGDCFQTLHSFLEAQCHHLLIIMDEVAQRISELGDGPVNTDFKMGMNNVLNIHREVKLTTNDMLQNLFMTNLNTQKKIRLFMKQNTQAMDFDPVTEELLVSLLKRNKKVSSMYKMHLS